MISIIVPVYNTAPYLDKCIESLVNQIYKDLEIILVDDCSNDGSADLIDQWTKKDNRIRIVHKERNSGVSETRNIALKMAQGDFIGFVDSDDWIEPDYYSEMVKLLDQTDADVVFAGYSRIEESRTIKVPMKEPDGTILPVDDALLRIMPQRGEGRYNLFIVDKLFRKSVIFNNDLILFDSAYSFGEDVLWEIEVLRNCKTIVFSRTCGYNYLITRGGNTWTEMHNYNSIKHCLSAVETNRRILHILHDMKSKAENNQLQRVLFYQRYAFRTAAKQKNKSLYRTYRKGYYPSLFKWYSRNMTLIGLKWFYQQIISDILFQMHRITKKW